MKKSILLLCSLLTFALASAQSIEYINLPQEEYQLNPELSTHILPFTVWNTSKDTIPLALEVLNLDMAEGHQFRLFWNYVCGEEGASSHQEIVMLAPGDTLESSWLREGQGADVRNYLEFEARSFSNKSNIELRILNLSNPSEFIDLKYNFSTTLTSALEELKQKAISAPYPNPAVNVAYLDYHLPESVEDVEIQLVNLIGQKMANIPLMYKGGTATISTGNMSSGVYFIYLMVEGKKWSTRKLVISK